MTITTPPPTQGAPAPANPGGSNASSGTGTGAPATNAADEAEARRKGEQAKADLLNFLQGEGSGIAGVLAKLFGMDDDRDPADAAARTIISGAVFRAGRVNLKDQAEIAGLHQWNGKIETQVENVKLMFKDMFAKGKLVFDSKDSVNNEAQMDAFLKKFDGMKTLKYAGAISDAIEHELRARSASLVINMSPKEAPATSPVSSGVQPGGITARADGYSGFGLNGYVRLYNDHHTLVSGGPSTDLAKLLGATGKEDKLQIQLVKHGNSIDGYYVSKVGSPGQGYYLDTDAIDMTRMDPKLKEQLYNAPAVASNVPAPGVGGPAPTAPAG